MWDHLRDREEGGSSTLLVERGMIINNVVAVWKIEGEGKFRLEENIVKGGFLLDS